MNTMRLHVFVISCVTLFALVNSIIYYYPMYAYEGIDRDFYLNKTYYVIYVIGRGLLISVLLNGLYLLLYFIAKGLLKVRQLQKG